MSAGDGWHANGSKREDESHASQGSLPWLRVPGRSGHSVLTQELELDANEDPDSRPYENSESPETVAVLLQLIEGSEIAKHLGGLAGVKGWPDESAFEEPASSAVASPTFKPPTADPPSTESSPPQSALFPLSCTPEAEESPESDEAVAALLRAIEDTETARSLGGDAPTTAGNPYTAAADESFQPAAGADIYELLVASPVPTAPRPEPSLLDASRPSAAESSPEYEEAVATWQNAIEDSEITKSLATVATQEDGQLEEAVEAEPKETGAEARTLEREFIIAAAAETAQPQGELTNAIAIGVFERPAASLPPAESTQPEPFPLANTLQSAPDDLAATGDAVPTLLPAAEANEIEGGADGVAALGERHPDMAGTTEPLATIADTPAFERLSDDSKQRAATAVPPMPVRGIRPGKRRRPRRRRRNSGVFEAAARRNLEEITAAKPELDTPALASAPVELPTATELLRVPVTEIEPPPSITPAQQASSSIPTSEPAGTSQPLTVFLAPMDAAPVPALVAHEASTPVIPTERAKPAEPLSVSNDSTFLPLQSATADVSPAGAPTQSPTPVNGAAPRIPSFALIDTDKSGLAATSDHINEGLDRAEMHLEKWFQKWFGPPDPRHTIRVSNPPLVAYHWIVDAPQAIKIANISAGGLHLLTKERWSEGNIVSMTLQRTDREKGAPGSWIAVDFLVMRWCEDGMAGAFIASVPGLQDAVAGRAQNTADKRTLESFVRQLVRGDQQ